MKKSYDFIIKNKLLSVLTLLSIASLVPLLVVCEYASPALDDFVHGSAMKHLLPGSYNVFTYLSTAINYSFSIYRELQGAFTINFLIALNPIAYNLGLIPVVYLVNYGLFLFSNYFFASVITRKFLKSDWKTTMVFTSIIVITSLQFIPLSESFYWYAGIMGYTLPYSLSLLFMGGLISLFKTKKSALRTFSLSLLAFALGGTNFGLALFLTAILVVTSLICFVYRSKKKIQLLLITSAFIIGFIINIVAQGNSMRFAMGFEKASPVKAVIMSFWGSALGVTNILAFSTIIFFSILILPKMKQLLSESNFDFRFPFILNIASLCVISTLYTPAFYTGIGETMPARYSNMNVMIIIWILFINLFYWLGWAIKNDKFDYSSKKDSITLAIIALVSLQVPFSVPRLNNISSISAAREVVTGITGAYKNDVTKLYQTMTDSKDKDVVYRIRFKPNSINYINIATDKTFWGNRAISRYFETKSLSSGE